MQLPLLQRSLDEYNHIWAVVSESGWHTYLNYPEPFTQTYICAVALIGGRSAWVFARLWPCTRRLHVRAEGIRLRRSERRVRIALATDRALQHMLTDNPEVWLQERTEEEMEYESVRPRGSEQSFELTGTPYTVSRLFASVAMHTCSPCDLYAIAGACL